MIAVTNSGKLDREWGDFQTPKSLAAKICNYLVKTGISPEIVIEPTFGIGNFICAALETFPQTQLIYGVEIKQEYEQILQTHLQTMLNGTHLNKPNIQLFQDDVFKHKFNRAALSSRTGELLIIGNPPWVTNSELGILASNNLPNKTNFKLATGLDALTGKGNFDIAEWIILKMLELFSERRGTLAMLCKNSVIRNIVEDLPRRKFAVSDIEALSIDANAEFGAAVDASLLVIKLGQPKSSYFCRTASLEKPEITHLIFGRVGDRFVANVAAYQQSAEIDGICPFEWRQGIKHDCSKIMELIQADAILYNGAGEKVEVEAALVYPLLKSSDLKKFEIEATRKKVIVTQQKLGEDTKLLRAAAPKLWQYLERNAPQLDKRKSSIYLTQPRFSMFGVEEYSFKPYKVAISGLYKRPIFSLVLPIEGRPVMLDDTCYFLAFDNYLEALFTTTLLNHRYVQNFLPSIVFLDAKRPYKKEVLMRIDLAKVITKLSFQEICNTWQSHEYKPRCPVTETDFISYTAKLTTKTDQGIQTSFNFSI